MVVKDDTAITLGIEDLLQERLSLKRSNTSPPPASGRWMGTFMSRRRGQGSEFDDLRHYVIGDDVRNIDWKASARTNTLNTRLHREEREHRVCILADLRDAMFTGTRQLRAASACRLAARLLWQAAEGGSRVTLIVISDEGLSLGEQATGHRAAIAGCALLANRFQSITQRVGEFMPASPSSLLRPTDNIIPLTRPESHVSGTVHERIFLDQVVHWLLQQKHRHGSLLWCSGLDHCGDEFDAVMALLSRVTDQLVIQIDDSLLRQALPSGEYGYCHPGTARQSASQVSLGRLDRRRLDAALRYRQQQLEQRFDALMIPLLSGELPPHELISALRGQGYLP